MNQPMIYRRLAAISVFQPALDTKYVGTRQRREGQPGHRGLGLFPARDNREHLLAIRYRIRIHASNTSAI